MQPKHYNRYERILTTEEELSLEAGGDPFASRRTGDPVKDVSYQPIPEYGFIAQDLEAISGMQDVVTPGSETVLRSVDYRGIGVLSVGAIKALASTVTTLSERIQQLEQRLAALEGGSAS
jgi:hypothetical protein